MKQYQRQILFERSELICLKLNLVKINEIKLGREFLFVSFSCRHKKMKNNLSARYELHFIKKNILTKLKVD